MTTAKDKSFTLERAGILAGALSFFSCISVAYGLQTGDLPIEGPAAVVDGDTIDVAGKRIRLEGIDAPETSQTCKRATGEGWACGREAQQVLSALVSNKSVACDQRGKDKYQRILAVCFADGEDINAFMVQTGYAWAFIKYSQSYVADEAAAKAAGAGVWQGESEAPWDYRHGSWQSASAALHADCPIKGNISRNGQIYHLPWMTWYGKVKIDERRGEHWFCSEDEAVAAGWRSAVQY